MWCKIGDLVHDVLVFSLDDDFAQVELAVHKPIVVGKVHPLGKLDCHIVDELDVGARHINPQVQILPLNVLKHVATFVCLDHGKVGTAHFVSETVEGSCDVRVRLQVDPPADVLVLRDLSDNELLAEVFMVYDESSIAEDMFDLNKKWYR